MASISGSSSDDTLLGFVDQHDTIYGLAGNDRIWGDGGNDTLYGGDTVNGGNDTLYGGISNDELFGGDQNDTLYGGNNDDTLIGGLGNDVIFGGSGIDTLVYINAEGSIVINLGQGSGAGDIYGGDFEVVAAGAFNDVLIGTTGGETFYGGGGDDLFHPLDGTDAVYGGSGNDRVAYSSVSAGVTIDLAAGTGGNANGIDGLFQIEIAFGSDHSDTIRGTALTETLGGDDGIDMIDYLNAGAAVTVDFGTNTSSGNGNDILSDFEIVRGSAFGDLLIGGSGIDTLRGDAGNDTVRGGLGNDVMDGGLGTDTLDYSTAPSGVTVDLGFGSATGGAGNDLFFPDFEVLVGSASGDRVTIGDNGASVFGGGGGDSIYGGAGSDWISGGTGADFLAGGLGRNTIDFSDATGQVILDLDQRTATLASGNDVVWNDFQVVIGSSFGDLLTGSSDNDTMYGGAGNDNLQGVFGTDTLFGGAGNDTYIFTDTVDVAVENAGNGTTDHVVAAFNHTLSGEIEILSLVTTTAVIGAGNASANTIYGGSANNVLFGGDGIDDLYGAAGNDTFYGGAGSDLLRGGIGDDTYFLGAGDIVFELTGEGIDRVVTTIDHTLASDVEIMELDDFGGNFNGFGNAAANTLYGNAANNALRGGDGNDLVYGRGGNDIVEGGQGNDTLYGGGGHDTFDYSNGFTTGETINLSAGTVFGSHGIDTLGGDFEVVLGSVMDSTIIGTAGTTLYGGLGNDVLSFGTGGMHGGAGNDLYHVDSSSAAFVFEASGEGTFDMMVAISSATLRDNVEVLSLINAGAVTGVGTGANDTISGGDADNFLFGLGGSDYITGDNGIDSIDGGLGNDLLQGGQGNDLVLGGEGDDYLHGNGGNDSLDGGAGSDTVYYVTGFTGVNVQLHTQLADAGVDGGFDQFTSIENVVTDFGDDQIWGNDVDNLLSGSFGNDWTHGFLGNDVLVGGGGNDQILGGGGADTLYGDFGNDYFWFDSSDAVFGGFDVDYAYNTDTTGVTVDLGLSSLEGVWANVGADLLDASLATWSVQLIGYGSGDTLRGGSGNDYIWFDELDSVTGGGGLDAAYAATANGVTVNYATQGLEQVWATNANDLLDASGLFSHGNYMVAYAGTDTVLAGSGNDFIWIDWDASDIMYGGPGRDEMYQIGTGALSLDLNAQGVEAVLGSNQGDVLNGTTQTQWLLLLGQGGNDTLTGSVLNDHLYGGTGDDTFVYTSVSGGRGTDAIHDFATGDKILAAGNNVVTGLGTATAVLSDGSTLVSDNGHNWIAGDFA